MSTAASPADPAGEPDQVHAPDAPDAPDGAAAESRGETRIEPKAVEKVAAQAVREVDNATGSPRRVLGMSLGSPDEAKDAKVAARVDGPIATVEVTMTVIYPASVREVTQQTRRHIRERVRELTGVQVQEVDITVAGMRVERPDTPRVR